MNEHCDDSAADDLRFEMWDEADGMAQECEYCGEIFCPNAGEAVCPYCPPAEGDDEGAQ